MKLNPNGQVPVLQAGGGKVVIGSENILDFVASQEYIGSNNKLRMFEKSQEMWWRTYTTEKLQPTGQRAVLSGSLTSDLSECFRTMEDRTIK